MHAEGLAEVLRSNDPVLLSWAEAVLADAGIETIVFDRHTAAIEGSIGALPRRLMVVDADPAHARRVLERAAPPGVEIAGFAKATGPSDA